MASTGLSMIMRLVRHTAARIARVGLSIDLSISRKAKTSSRDRFHRAQSIADDVQHATLNRELGRAHRVLDRLGIRAPMPDDDDPIHPEEGSPADLG